MPTRVCPPMIFVGRNTSALMVVSASTAAMPIQ
jgi:hypothetical protein